MSAILAELHAAPPVHSGRSNHPEPGAPSLSDNALSVVLRREGPSSRLTARPPLRSCEIDNLPSRVRSAITIREVAHDAGLDPDLFTVASLTAGS